MRMNSNLKNYSIRGIRSSQILNNDSKVENLSGRNNSFIPEKYEVNSVRMFNLEESLQSQKRTYILQFDESRTSYVAAEITLKIKNHKNIDSVHRGLTIWYLEDEEVGRNDFNLEIKKDWELVEFVQSWGTPLPGFWKQGEGRIEVLLENNLILKQVFEIGTDRDY